jgi:uncharacterized membrane protein
MHARSSRIGLAWARVRDSLWFVPTLAVLTGSVLAVTAVQIPTPEVNGELARLWLFGGGAEGARGVLSAIAGSLITVTGVVFSVTIVALQLASSQFTPRVLGSFVADRVNQVVLGVFIGTFTYTLLVLRTIRSEADDRNALVPHVGVTLALLLLLVSIGALIVFINHSARSIQASVILHREAVRTLAHVDELFPERVGRPESSATDVNDRPDEAARPAGRPASVTAHASGYLQSVDADALWSIGERHRSGTITVHMEMHVGAFTFPGKRLASVWPADAVDEHVERAIRAAFVLGHERTIEQDAELGLVVMSDIAVRALSPGVNDPTTATHCIDRLTEVLAALCTRHHPTVLRRSPDGTVRLLVRDTPFGRAVGLAFDQIRHFGAGNPSIAKKLLEALTDLAAVAPSTARRPLAEQVEAVARHARRAIEDPFDLAAVERLVSDALIATREVSAVVASDAAAPPPASRASAGD